MTKLIIGLVRCSAAPEKYTELVRGEVDWKTIETSLIETVEQNLDAGISRDLHNAAHHPEHGPVTYFQAIHDGGFSVFVGPPEKLTETFFGPGEFVAFTDDQGPGHASRVGPQGVRRTMRVLKGLLQLETTS